MLNHTRVYSSVYKQLNKGNRHMKIAVEEWELYNNGYLLIKWFDTEIDTIEDIEAYISKIKASYRLNSDI